METQKVNCVIMKNPFTEQLHALLEKSEMSQLTLAKGAGKSSASISKFLNGKAIPSPETYQKLREFLNLSEDEEAELDQAYIFLHTPDIGKTKAFSYKAPQNYMRSEDLDPNQYLDANKALLRRHVEEILGDMGINFTSNHVQGGIAADYLINQGGVRIALICSRHAQFLEGMNTAAAADWIKRFDVHAVCYVTSDLSEFSVCGSLFSVSLFHFKEALAKKFDA